MDGAREGLVVVTGGTGALGVGVVDVLRAAGHRVLVTWVVEGEAARARGAWGDAVELRRLDVGDAGAVSALADELDERDPAWGLVHLVGGYLDGAPVAGMDLEALDGQIALNLRTTAVSMRAFLPGMQRRGGGRVVATSSRAALRPFAGAGAYAASKAGVIALVGAAAEEAKQDGVTVNCVVPSVIDTPANRRASPGADPARWVAPEAIGHVVRFLLSPEAGALTGAAIPVYGRA
jgi:NAD(P)-dependent dehydrogenase (short-subunit alcohol dehydrogenase family)